MLTSVCLFHSFEDIIGCTTIKSMLFGRHKAIDPLMAMTLSVKIDRAITKLLVISIQPDICANETYRLFCTFDTAVTTVLP